MSLQSFRERVNLFLYASKERNLRILRYASFFVSLSAFTLLVIFYGFDLERTTKALIISIIKGTFAFYVLAYIIKFIYTFEPLNFLKKTRLEGILMLLIVIDGISYFLFNIPLIQNTFYRLGFHNFTDIYILFIQFYLLLIVSLDLSAISTKISKLNIAPSTIFILSFISLIAIGTVLLMLPEMNTTKRSMPFLEALFTSISASCVTGLTVVDTATYFTTKGQFVIMMLMQLGGLSIISFATFIISISGSGFGIKQQLIMKDFLSTDSLFSTKGLLHQIILLTLTIETAGAILIYFLWDPSLYFETVGDKVFYSIFHAISAFNNAGFSLFSNGLYEEGVRNSYMLHIVIGVLIFFGGIGFSSIRDLFGLESLRQRLKYPWKQIKLTTQIALYVSLALIMAGAIAFYLLEKNNTLSQMRFVEAIITSIFQSVSARTAGFNTVDFSLISQPMLIFFIFLMFIGASSGSTGGGIKTSTFALLIISAYSTIIGKRNFELGRYSISYELMNRAFSIAFFASGIVFIGVFILTITDPEIPILQLVFEEVSAFATVGLTTGITPNLSTAGKIVLMCSMFIGRIGILTLAFTLSNKVVSQNYKLPNAHIMVG
jgi:potassium uptake TrkH family protein